MNLNTTVSEGRYSSIDLNSTGATTIFDPDGDAEVTGVYLANGGTSAEIELQATDGTDTATLAAPGAGNPLEFDGTFRVGGGDSVAINVATAEGAAQTNTVVVFSTT